MKLRRRFLSTAALIFTIYLQDARAAIYSEPHQNLATLKDRHYTSKVLVPKVSLTQKGYIQFLRYVVDVPELTDYTFCIWVRSNNLTYSHPLLSYSKHEKERLIRVWISPLGTHVNLEILKVPIFSVPVQLIENEWYHICQSWSSLHAAWSLYLNGKLKVSGYAPKLRKVAIDSGGDLVVGQEYTDFDKGLDDGIEGDISGFNLVLASTFNGMNVNKHLVKPHYATNNLFKRETRVQDAVFDDPFFADSKRFDRVMNAKKEAPEKSHTRRQIWDESLELFSNHKLVPPLPLDTQQEFPYQPQIEMSLFEQKPKAVYTAQLYQPFHQKFVHETSINKGLQLRDYVHKPLGLLLVELSNDCGYLRGAPLSGKGVLVSWTKTEVRVFGGAILKTVAPFCVR